MSLQTGDPQGGQRCRQHRHSGLDVAVYRDENDEEQRSSALKAHTLAQRDQRLVNPQGRRNAVQSNYWLRHGASSFPAEAGIHKRCNASSQSCKSLQSPIILILTTYTTRPRPVIPRVPHRHSPRKRETTQRCTCIVPSPLTGEESKVRVKTMPQHRHSGLDPESTGRGHHQSLCDTAHLLNDNFC